MGLGFCCSKRGVLAEDSQDMHPPCISERSLMDDVWPLETKNSESGPGLCEDSVKINPQVCQWWIYLQRRSNGLSKSPV